MNHASRFSSAELQNSVLQVQDVLLKLYVAIKGYGTGEYVVDLRTVLFPSVDKNNNSSDSEDDDRGSNEQ
jgi:hypothetical protein